MLINKFLVDNTDVEAMKLWKHTNARLFVAPLNTAEISIIDAQIFPNLYMFILYYVAYIYIYTYT